MTGCDCMAGGIPNGTIFINSLKNASRCSRFSSVYRLLNGKSAFSEIKNEMEEEEMENSTNNQPMEESCQTHDHEFEASTKLAEEGEDRHNHRFAGVTTQMIPFPDGHRHVVCTNTDFFENHHHEIGALSGTPIPVGNGKHVHFFTGNSTMDDGHFHEFQFTTLIDDPLH